MQFKLCGCELRSCHCCAIQAAGAIKAYNYTPAIMYAVRCVMYLTRAGGETSYNDITVPYRNHDHIRAGLNTAQMARTAYTSGPAGAGMIPVWGYAWPNQIEMVNTSVLPALRRLVADSYNHASMRDSLWECTSSVVLCTTMDDQHLSSLADWFLFPAPLPSANSSFEIGQELF